MRFNPGADLDTSQISDRRGMGRGTLAVGGGGGLVGVLVLVFSLLAGGETGLAPSALDNPGTPSNLAAECRTGVDANNEEDCRIVGVVNSVQEYWNRTLPNYREASTTFFTAGVNTSCGAATSAVGPFYCPVDEGVYIDLSFYDDLRSRFGANGGPFAEAYVIAHEYGHHVENQLGVLERANNDSGANSDSVRVELMADCLAGMWAKGATQTAFITELSDQDIRDGLDAAAAIGDDRIQQRARGGVDKESWTHGSSAQRQKWFTTGMNATTIQGCDTFRVATV